ncbi:MAG: hypothetical protein JKY43_06965, partial [Phycisphaerales bacterium]|nr:hypothetical protein [Phycisphaerales bacterium]
IILGEFLGRPVGGIGGMGLVYVALCAHSGYLFDRVKFRDADLDPADLMADPIRHGFLRRWAKWLRILMVAEWIGAVAVGGVISPVLGVVVLGGVFAGYVYSGWRPGKGARLKDLAGLKAGLVASAVVGLGIAAVLGAEIGWDDGMVLPEIGVWPWMMLGGVWLIVCGDAVVCDLDDRASDGVHSTRSLPVMIGMRRAGIVAAGFLVFGGLLVAISGDGPDRMRVVFAGMIVVSGIGIMRLRKRRDWIDGRMLVVVLVVVLFS